MKYSKKRRNRLAKKTRKIKDINMKNIYKDITGTISIKSVSHNLNELRRLSKIDVMPVLKANAYGHGIIEMAKICRDLGVKYIGVATIGEAIQLRESGDKGRILGWLYDVNGPEIVEAIKKNIDIGLFDESHIDIISSKIPKNKKTNIHLFVDTGINRNGVNYDNAFDAAKKISKNPKFKLVGLMSHLCCSDEKNTAPTVRQLTLFRELRQKLIDNGINPELVHIGNTDAIFNYDLSDFTLVRSGSGLYGYTGCSTCKTQLIPVMDVKSKIIQVKKIKKGNGVGYNRTFIAPKDMMIGIIPVGYADFIPRISNKSYVNVNGTKRKILGVISMDQMVIEAKERDKLGDDVLLFGNPEHGYVHLDEYADSSKTIGSTILTHIGQRVKHVYE